MDGLTTQFAATRGARLILAALIRWIWNVRQYGHRLIRFYGTWEWGLVMVGPVAPRQKGNKEILNAGGRQNPSSNCDSGSTHNMS